MNKVDIIGRLTKDAEIRYTQNQKMVACFTIAVNRKFAKENEQQVDFINCIAWSKMAEVVEKYLKKGSQVGISGRIQTRTYEDNGQKKYITEIVAEEIHLLGSRINNDNLNENGEINENDATVGNKEDLPF